MRDDSGFYRDLTWAIAATGAGRSDVQLAAEDEMRAVMVASLGEEGRRPPGAARRFTITVLGAPPSATLVRELARRGLAPAGPGDDRATHIAFGEVVWTAGDMATVHYFFRRDMDSPPPARVVVLTDGRWSVVPADLRGGR